MARMNADCGAWVTELLEVGPSDNVLEVGFGPGVVIQCLSKLASAGHVAGIDPSREMVEQARARNAIAIQSGRLDLRHGSVENLPFQDNLFDEALAINSLQVWPDAVKGLREMRRVMKPGGRVVWLYALFGAAEQRLDGNAHGRCLHGGARGGDRQGVLCAGDETVTAAQPALR